MRLVAFVAGLIAGAVALALVHAVVISEAVGIVHADRRRRELDHG